MRFSSFTKQAELIKARLKAIHAQVTVIYTIENPSDQQTAKLKLLVTTGTNKFNEFERIVNKLYSTSPLPEDIDQDTIIELQNEISDLHISIQSCITVTECDTSRPTDLNTSETQQPLSTSAVNLPRFNLPTFTGRLECWVSFQSLFENTIHKNGSISNVEKFSYLLSSLSGEPLSLIKSLPMTAANYLIAWQTLVKRYHNSRLLISLHVNNILDLPSVNSLSVKTIRHFLSSYNENKLALEALGHNLANESLILTTHLLRKFCPEIRNKFEHARNCSETVPNLDEFINYLDKECQRLEVANLAYVAQPYPSEDKFVVKNNPSQSSNRHKPNKVGVSMFISSHTQMCSYCSSSSHVIYRCDNFKSLSTYDRLAFIKEKQLCQNCFGTHKLSDCNSKHNCNMCGKRHHSMLHHSQPLHSAKMSKNTSLGPPPVSIQKPADNVERSTRQPSTPFVGMSCNQNTTVLLSTAVVKISSHSGDYTVARAVLDSASQTTFITEKIASLLKLSRSNEKAYLINGISSSQVKTKGVSHVTLSSLSGTPLASSYPVVILDKITGDLPKFTISPELKSKLKHFGLTLADPTFDTPAPIDLLIGADLFALCLQGSPISLGTALPSAVNTIFGYVIIGIAPILSPPAVDETLVTMLTMNELNVHNAMQRFWSLEEPPLKPNISPEDLKCEEHFLATHSRNDNGKYICSLPFRESPSTLGNSSKSSLKMLFSLERKFKRQPDLKHAYVDFFNEYIEQGHMILCPTPPIDEPHCYLPHHAVFKNGKIRVVFNASAMTTNNNSLNSILHNGPKLHNNIVDIIFRLRFDRFVFLCDIKQMFTHIMVSEADQNFQLIFWRDDERKPVETYKLTSVTFGLASSPYLANRVIKQLIIDEGHHHPLAAEALSQQVYVDDICLGCSTELEALNLQQEITHLLRRGGFELRKWTSNSPVLMKSVPEAHQGKPIHFFNKEEPTFSVLGLMWSPNSDNFMYNIEFSSQTHTKRSVLSLIAKIFDPCGWLAPIVLWAKALMQHLWTLGLNWDDTLPDPLCRKWSQFLKGLHALDNIRIPRFLSLDRDVTSIQLHGFSDASEIAYAACVFIRLEHSSKIATTQLLIGKSRVAPLKRISLPRLELCGAHMLSKLLNYCSTQVVSRYKIDSIYAWSDSVITLSWIHTPSYRLKTFVANRVADIQELASPAIWKYVPSAQNPADCASRGVLPSDFSTHSMWWSGPSWLKCSLDVWPNHSFNLLKEDSLPDLRPPLLENLAATDSSTFDLLYRFSSWKRLVRVTAYILRFIDCLKNKCKNYSLLTPSEVESASNRVCWLLQKDEFSEEINLLRKGKPCTARVNRLAPFLDGENVIRVGGRLRNSLLDTQSKHPILLPKKHHVVNILIDYFHVRELHSGPVQLQATITQRYWILSARSIIRSRVFKCIRCFKTKPKIIAPFMGDLPAERVTPTRPFATSGVDYAGPFMIKLHLLRRLQHVKVYICLFICFATKAVHIEVVSDLTSDAFIASLTRFISRRGLVSNLHSDCGTNFVGAAATLRKCFQNLMKTPQLQAYALENHVKFHFLPPHAPHQGGLWERAVKSAKHHLHRVVGNQILTLEEFSTLTTRIEAMLNSRPLTPLTSDPNDLTPLTPGHFLTGGPLTALIEPDYLQIATNKLKRWQLVQSFTQHIWCRWVKEYLYTLQERSKWKKTQTNLKVNDLVIVHDWNSPPLQWKLARITAVTTGADGVVRVVQLKTTTGNFSRPAVKVSLLPIH